MVEETVYSMCDGHGVKIRKFDPCEERKLMCLGHNEYKVRLENLEPL